MPLLVVDGDPVPAAALAQRLRADGFEVEVLATGAAALERLRTRDVDAVLLELGLPDMEGMAVLTTARERGIHVPVLVLSARDELGTRVAAFDLGADDFVLRPYAYEELLARLRALLRRAAGPRWGALSCNGLVLRDDDLTVSIRDEQIALSPREHDLLGFFLRRKGEVINRSAILLHVFGYQFDPGTNLVNVHVAHLRRKIGVQAVCIETVRGFGYRLRAATEMDSAPAR